MNSGINKSQNAVWKKRYFVFAFLVNSWLFVILLWSDTLVILTTSHASIAHPKRPPPQGTESTIGSVWQVTPLRRKLRGQHKHAKRNAMKTNSRKCQTAHARPLLEAAGFSQLVLVLISNSDCCNHRPSVATSLRSYSYQRSLVEKPAG